MKLKNGHKFASKNLNANMCIRGAEHSE